MWEGNNCFRWGTAKVELKSYYKDYFRFMYFRIYLISLFSVYYCICFCQSNAYELVKFKQLNAEPFPICLVMIKKLSIDSTLAIEIVDGNRDGKFRIRQDKSDFNCDYLKVYDTYNRQFLSIPLQSNCVIKYYDQLYSIKYNERDLNCEISQICDFNLKIDGYIINTIPFKYLKKLSNNESILVKNLFVGKSDYVYFSFWAPYCVPCLQDIKDEVNYKKEFEKARIKIIHINIFDDLERSKEFLKKNRIYGEFYYCTKSNMNDWNCNGFPSGVMFRANGTYSRHFKLGIHEILNLKGKYSK